MKVSSSSRVTRIPDQNGSFSLYAETPRRPLLTSTPTALGSPFGAKGHRPEKRRGLPVGIIPYRSCHLFLQAGQHTTTLGRQHHGVRITHHLPTVCLRRLSKPSWSGWPSTQPRRGSRRSGLQRTARSRAPEAPRLPGGGRLFRSRSRASSLVPCSPVKERARHNHAKIASGNPIWFCDRISTLGSRNELAGWPSTSNGGLLTMTPGRCRKPRSSPG